MMNTKIPFDTVAVIFDDHKIFAASFATFLERTGFFSKVYHFDNEKEIKDFFVKSTFKNSVLFLDYFVPGCNTVYVLDDLRRLSSSIKVVVISAMTNPSLVKRMLLNKVDGFISKTDGLEEVMACLKTIYSKQIYYSAQIRALIDNESEKSIFELSARELEVLTLLSWSKSIDQISDELNISKHTVITHRRNMLTKSGCNSVTELVAYALRADLISKN